MDRGRRPGAIDHEPGGRQHGYVSGVRSPGRWAAYRLGLWLGPDGLPLPSRSQLAAADRQRVRAEQARRRAEQREPAGYAEGAAAARAMLGARLAELRVYWPPAERASASISSRWRSSTFTTAPMIRCLGRRVAKWMSSTRPASRSAEAFGMYQLRMVMSGPAGGAGGGAGVRGGGVLAGLAGLADLSGLVARGCGAGSAVPMRALRFFRSAAITAARARGASRPGRGGRRRAPRTRSGPPVVRDHPAVQLRLRVRHVPAHERDHARDLQVIQQLPRRFHGPRSPERVGHVDHGPVRHLVVGAQLGGPDRGLDRGPLGNHRDQRIGRRGEHAGWFIGALDAGEDGEQTFRYQLTLNRPRT